MELDGKVYVPLDELYVAVITDTPLIQPYPEVPEMPNAKWYHADWVAAAPA